jgi:GTP cyclohydrolase I
MDKIESFVMADGEKVELPVEQMAEFKRQMGQQMVKGILTLIGEDPSREGLLDTPKRVQKSWAELFAGYQQNPKEILSTAFEDGACDEMVILKEIDFTSMCEHHMLPFIGKAHIGYLPNKRVVGLSKLARLVECFAKRLQIQEKMTQQIAQAIAVNLDANGVAVVIEAHHQCMSCRGVRKSGTTMVTSSMLGRFRDDLNARQEFLSLVKG